VGIIQTFFFFFSSFLFFWLMAVSAWGMGRRKKEEGKERKGKGRRGKKGYGILDWLGPFCYNCFFFFKKKNPLMLMLVRGLPVGIYLLRYNTAMAFDVVCFVGYAEVDSYVLYLIYCTSFFLRLGKIFLFFYRLLARFFMDAMGIISYHTLSYLIVPYHIVRKLIAMLLSIMLKRVSLPDVACCRSSCGS
jgi:hypothetical protein